MGLERMSNSNSGGRGHHRSHRSAPSHRSYESEIHVPRPSHPRPMPSRTSHSYTPSRASHRRSTWEDFTGRSDNRSSSNDDCPSMSYWWYILIIVVVGLIILFIYGSYLLSYNPYSTAPDWMKNMATGVTEACHSIIDTCLPGDSVPDSLRNAK